MDEDEENTKQRKLGWGSAVFGGASGDPGWSEEKEARLFGGWRARVTFAEWNEVLDRGTHRKFSELLLWDWLLGFPLAIGMIGLIGWGLVVVVKTMIGALT